MATLQERRLGYHSQAGLEPGTSRFSTLRYVCMGCQGPVSYFSTYKAAACHFANSPTCNQSGRSIRVVTIQARPGDRDAGGLGAAGTWEPRNTSAKGEKSTCNMLYNTPVT